MRTREEVTGNVPTTRRPAAGDVRGWARGAAAAENRDSPAGIAATLGERAGKTSARGAATVAPTIRRDRPADDPRRVVSSRACADVG